MQTLKQKYSCKHIITLDAKCKQEIVDKKIELSNENCFTQSPPHMIKRKDDSLTRWREGGEKLQPAREKQKKSLGMSESRNGTSIFCS